MRNATTNNDHNVIALTDKRSLQGVAASTDIMIANLACKYLHIVKRMKDAGKRGLALGNDAQRDWKTFVRSEVPGFADCEQRIQTGVDSESGGGDLRSQRMFDIVFRVGSITVCIEVQTSDYTGHKPSQLQAQMLYVREVCSTAAIFYKVIAESEKGARLFRWTRFDTVCVDLTSLLRSRL